MDKHIVLGVDIGGTGIKGGLVDIKKGEMASERHRLLTPQPATPAAVAQTFKEFVDHFQWEGPIGVGFPAIVKENIAHTATNISKEWLGKDIAQVLAQPSGAAIHVVNDADAAGIASAHFGSAAGQKGVVILLTIGTGIGSALFANEELVPNSELGHLYLANQATVAEKYISNKVRKTEELSWQAWGERFNVYLHHIGRLFSPNLVLLSGGASKNFDNFKDTITVDYQVQPASLLNQAGCIGAAYYAHLQER